MSIDANSHPPAAGLPGPRIKPVDEPVKLLKLPGLIAMSAYMILLAVVAVFSGLCWRFPLFHIIPLKKAAALRLPISFLATQWESTLTYDHGFLNLPAAQNPNGIMQQSARVFIPTDFRTGSVNTIK